MKEYILYSGALLLFVLGFIALLKHKIYVDSRTKEPMEIELPFFGKMKTNYPALAFVFAGLILAGYTYKLSNEETMKRDQYAHDEEMKKLEKPKIVDWEIRGQFKLPEGDKRKINWENGTMLLSPAVLPEIKPDGVFKISGVKIEQGKRLEDQYSWLDFSSPWGSYQVELQNEYDKYERHLESLVENATDKTRKYKPITINPYEHDEK